ncbi:MAG: phage tail sheath C-terminal domain-containing protein [Vicinamibacterales bacterium]
MAGLVVPGVRVEARFDILPPLPAASGILGAVGIVDRPPAQAGLVSVTKVAEIRDLLGPGTEVSMPQIVEALANGASEVLVSPVAGGASAVADLLNANSQAAVRLRCRSKGAWGNELSADVRAVLGGDDGKTPVRVTLRLLRGGRVVESFSDLRILPGAVDDLFQTINASSRYVVALDPGFDGAVPAAGTYSPGSSTVMSIPRDGSTTPLMELVVADGASPDGLSVQITLSSDKRTIGVQLFQGGLQESFTGLVTDPDDDNYLPLVLQTQSRLVRARIDNSLAVDARMPKATDAPVAFHDGASPSTQQYADAIEVLADDTRADLVLAAIEPGRPRGEVRAIHQSLAAHAVKMADEGAPRIAFGSLAADEKSLGDIREHSALVRNRRFVLVAPAGAEGAVAGLIGRLNPQESPTFKPVPLFGRAPASFRQGDLNRLLGPTTNLLVVQDRAGHGVVVLRGLDTSGDQVSVTRVADQAIRETKAISENFIGELNSEQARTALKQQIVATLTRMERAGALVPSTDGKDPAFIVDVYSTQLDFAQGIVRVDIAVRPVRAIDYIYATIRVKN